MNYNSRRLFVASCIALITSAFSFQMRQDVADDMGAHFQLTRELVGELMGGQFLGMALAMLVFSPLCDWIGMGKVLGIAFLAHAFGITGTIFAGEIAAQGFVPNFANGLHNISGWIKDMVHFTPMPTAGANELNFWVLWVAAFLIGSGNGLVEVAINPLAATLYPEEKTHKLNVLHAWWPGGLIIAGMLALFFVNPLFGKNAEFFNYTIDPAKLGIGEFVGKISSWQFKYGLLYLPLLLYGLMAAGQRFPETERVQARVSTGTMFLQVLHPLFLLLAVAMILTASTELGTNAWMESTLKRTADVSGTMVFVYITFLMFILRFFAGPLVHKFSPIGLLFICSILTAAGLYWLSYATDKVTAFAAATVFGLGITYYWPTMLGVTAERFPKGGALLLGLMGCVGNLAISQVVPLMGAVNDSHTVHSLPADVRSMSLNVEGGPKPIKDGRSGAVLQNVPLVFQDTDHPVPKWMPPQAKERLYPAENYKLKPEARTFLEDIEKMKKKADKTGEELSQVQLQTFEKNEPTITAVKKAETEGAAWAFRWSTAMPVALIAIFGFIGLVDKARGGYKQVHLNTGPPGGNWPKR